MKRKWFDKKVLILGLSKSGIAAARYLNSKGADCYISEFKEADENDSALISELEAEEIRVETGGHSDDFLEDAYIAIVSPGIAPHKPIFSRLKEMNIPFISEVELAYLETTTPFIGVTGTNGKTTVTELISHLLSVEYKAPVCGNIGVPPTSLIDNKNDYLVCELSSYQIETSPTLKPQIACFINFAPDHLEWHQGIDNYFSAKAKLFAEHKAPAFAVFNALDKKVFEFSQSYAEEKFLFGREFEKNCCYVKDGILFFKKNIEEEIIKISEILLIGEHNLQNIMCAVIVAKIIGIANDEVKNLIRSFKAIEHRFEFVTNLLGKDFYNDSKATNPEATVFAINSFENKTLTLIAGGKDKNTDLKEFVSAVKTNVNQVILIGEAKDRFKENLENNDFHNIIFAESLQNAIDKAVELDNEIVLFSPACASFDMFDNYEKRGEAFKEYVLSKV